MVSGLVADTDRNEVASPLRRFSGGTDELVQLVPFWCPLFDLTGNYGFGVSLVLAMLTSMRPVTETSEDLSRRVGRRL